MKEFFNKFFLLGFMVMVSVLLIWFLPGSYNHDLAPIINKTLRLEKTKPPRIILLGGSGLVVGIDSPALEKTFKIPVVNMGLWAGFGLKFLIEVVKPYIQPGDILVIIPEYGTLKTTSIMDINEESRKWFFLVSPQGKLIYRDNKKALLKDQFLLFQLKAQGFLRNLIQFRLSSFFNPGSPQYSGKFNENGDIRNDPFVKRLPKDLEGFETRFNLSLEERVFTFLNDFYSYVESKGGKAYLIYSCLPQEEYQRNEDEIKKLEESFKNNLKIPVLGNPKDFLYPYTYFSNTINHLANTGKSERTQKIIRLLQSKIK